jgi:transcriptional regulator with XRE-family HTH domain
MDGKECLYPADHDLVVTSFAALLRRHRISQRLTQEDLAFASGLSVRAVRNVELGRVRCPRRDSVKRLAEALKLPVYDHRQLAMAARAQRFEPTVPSDSNNRRLDLEPGETVTVLVRRDVAVGLSVRLSPALRDTGDYEVTILVEFDDEATHDTVPRPAEQGTKPGFRPANRSVA